MIIETQSSEELKLATQLAQINFQFWKIVLNWWDFEMHVFISPNKKKGLFDQVEKTQNANNGFSLY